MKLDPQAQAILDIQAAAWAKGAAKFHELSAKAARETYLRGCEAFASPAPKVESVTDLAFEGPGGPLPVRLYRPLDSDSDALLPVLVFFHGRGFVVGDLDSHDTLCRRLCNQGGFAVLAVDYSRAPEHPFPAAMDDAYAAVEWAAAHGAEYGIDPSRMAVGGDSAGGTLSAVVCLMARDEKGPEIAFQALLYPGVDMSFSGGSKRSLGEGYILDQESMGYFYRHFMGDAGDREDWRASPLKAPDHSGLPPALILTAGFDPLKDEGLAYADKLKAAGVEVNYSCYEGMLHGFLTMDGMIDMAGEAIAEIAQEVAQGLRRVSQP